MFIGDDSIIGQVTVRASCAFRFSKAEAKSVAAFTKIRAILKSNGRIEDPAVMPQFRLSGPDGTINLTII